MFLINPANHDFQLYKFLIENYNEYDGGIIGKLFFPCLSNKDYCIDSNYLYNIYNIKQTIKSLKNIYGFHYGLKEKPFLKSHKRIFNKIYFKLYYSYLDYYKIKYNL